MSANALLQVAIYLAALLLLTKPMGLYLHRAMEGRLPVLGKLLGPLERLLYRISGVNPQQEMGWKSYTVALLLFNAIGVLTVFCLQRWQDSLPLNPAGMGEINLDSAFNTAVSFAPTPTGRAMPVKAP